MLPFYRDQYRGRVGKIFVESVFGVEKWAGVLWGIFVVALAFLTSPVQDHLMSAWQGLPVLVIPVFVMASVVVLFVRGLLKANWQDFEEVKQERKEHENSLSSANKELKTDLRVTKLEAGTQLEQSKQECSKLQSQLTQAKEEKETLQVRLQEEKQARKYVEAQLQGAYQQLGTIESQFEQAIEELKTEREKGSRIGGAMYRLMDQFVKMRNDVKMGNDPDLSEEKIQDFAQRMSDYLESELGKPEAEYFMRAREELMDDEFEGSREEALLDSYLERLEELQRRLLRRY